MRYVIFIFLFFSERAVWRVGGGGGVCCQTFVLLSFPCSADHEQDWPPCKVAIFGLAINTLNVRNNNFKHVKRRIAAPSGSSLRLIVSGYPRLWLRGGIQVDCVLVPSNGLTMSGVFFFNCSTGSCRYIPLHLLLI